jgi:hypothetical protein
VIANKELKNDSPFPRKSRPLKHSHGKRRINGKTAAAAVLTGH